MDSILSTPGIELPPVAPFLMQSLRAVGYTTSAALADLIDNSIAADAQRVAIRLQVHPEPSIAIIDDGHGMHDQALVAAMRFGSRDPREARTGLDLGRFGLGLKTASLSQCRRLTVVSLADGSLSCAAWDLDDCERRGTWWLGRPDPAALAKEIVDQLIAQGRGTAVIWSKLDRLTATGGTDGVRAVEIAIDSAVDHLALIFHRFLAGEMGHSFDITINGQSVPRLDPFLEGHARGQILHSESFPIEGHAVLVSPFVLPFPSRLRPADLERVGGRESLRTGHGFYVYRGGRLVVPGGWFRIVPSDELIRLARVRVDVPVELDRLWKIDIRKTVVEPPAALRPHLRRIVGAVTLRSRRVYSYRGSPEAEEERTTVWQRHELRDQAAAWRINRDNPAVAAFARPGTDLDALLRVLEDTLPVYDIHLHLSNDLPVSEESEITGAELEALARRMIDAFRDRPDQIAAILEQLPKTDPFSRDPDGARRLAEGLRQ
jgi:Histidine kinase-, DNA gyrase B-, and HSP90-like ATPase